MPFAKKTFKHIICILILAAIIMPQAGRAANHEKLFGLSGGYVTRNESAIASVWFTYGLNNYLRLSPNATYVFKHNGVDAFVINADCHFTFRPAKKVVLYPLAGVGYWSWNTTTHIEDSDDVSSRVQRFALNVGAGAQWMATSTLLVGFEAKYALMKHSPSALFSVSIGYRF